MKVAIKGKEKDTKGELPEQFNEPVREDLIRRAVFAAENNARHAYGSDPRAGQKHSAELSRRRRKYRGSYGFGISRVPRKILTRRGTRFFWVGAQIPGTVGGRRAHAPKAEKKWGQKLNKKENRKAIRSAIAATAVAEMVSARGHKIPKDYPFILDESFESLKKTNEVIKYLKTAGLDEELNRSRQKTIRAGKGTMRNRRYKKRKGPLVVVSGSCEAIKATKNLPGVDVTLVNELNASVLAPGTIAGRATLFTAQAIERMKKEKLFM
ncbi:MAG: 50S ribosomal protein L4 [Candidatus Woesearchaeota archaeon]